MPEKYNPDREATVRQILEGEASFPTGAYNDETGTFVMPKPVDLSVVQDQSTGLWLPPPTQKRVTRLIFDVPGLQLDVSEDYDTVTSMLTAHKTGDLEFTSPVYADDKVTVRAAHVKHIVGVGVDYMDLGELELARKQREYNLKLAETELARARAQNLGRNNGRRR